jgi:DNA-binding beta-propeller fold protein YncE
MENVLGRLIRIAIVIVAASGLMIGVLALMSCSAPDAVVLAIAPPGYTFQLNGEQSGTLILPHVTVTLHLSPGIGFGPSAIGINPTTGYIYVVNSSDEWQYHQGNPIVSVLSGAQVITNVQMPSRPLDVAVNPTNGYIYVALDTDDLAVLSGTRVITTLPGVGGTVHAVNLATGLVYMAKPEGEAISVLSGAEVVTTIVARGLRDMEAAPDSGLVYASAYPQDGTLIYQGTLTVLSGTQVITVVTGLTDGPAAIGVNPVNSYIYVANSLTDTVMVVSGTEVIATVPTGYDLGYWAGGGGRSGPGDWLRIRNGI